MIPLIINADDFGLSDGVSRGIVQALHAGGVTATTAMVCAPDAVEHIRRWAPEIEGYIGAHLQLTSGTPMLPPERVPSLVLEDGKFPARRKEIRSPRTEEVFAEWQAQIECLVRVGIEPSHLDSHHHVHGLPALFPAFCELAKQYSLPARSLHGEMTHALHAAGVACIDQTLTGWYGGKLSMKSLVRVLQEGTHEYAAAKSFELMCHPGLVDDSLNSLSRYVTERELELTVLCDAHLQRELAAAGFRSSRMPSPSKAMHHAGLVCSATNARGAAQ